MFFQQFYLQSLGHASYLVGSEATGEALVFDARRDVGDYFTAAHQQGLRIAYAMDSHGHNDYLSGLGEVAARGDVTVLGPATGELGYEHRPLADGDVIEMGEVRIEALHTPGHTPEHVSLLISDRSGGDEPAMLLSGGSLLVGDLARPDLLGGPEQAARAAEVFCATIQRKLLPLPDYVEVYPTHVSGSLCGGNIGSRLSTTVGYERRTNAILAQVDAKDEFVRECLRLDNLPAVPPYWRRMRRQNMEGVPRLGVLREPPALPVDAFARRMREAGVVVLDTRQPEAFGAGHIPGALNAGFGSSFPTWAGTVVPGDARILLVLDRPEDLWPVCWELLRIGYPLPAGWLGGMFDWRTSGEPLARLPQVTVHELRSMLERADAPRVLDVRQPAEWAEGHIEGATFITGAELPSRLGDVPEGETVAVICGSGYRSSAAASLLAHHGVQAELVSVLGGMTAWQNAGYPVADEEAAGRGS